MIRKFAAVPVLRIALTVIAVLTILAGAASLRAQQPAGAQSPAPTTSSSQPPAQQPTAQQPPAPQPDNQEPSTEDTTPRNRLKPREYKNWNFNVGGGAATYSGTTRQFVRGGGLIGSAGVARNYSRFFGLRADFQFDNLPLRSSALDAAGAPGANSHVYSLMLDPIINIPASKLWSGYIVFGPAYLHRTGKLDSSTAIPGDGCSGFFIWWGRCFAGSLPSNVSFLTSSQNEFGENFGGGIAHRIRPNLEIYAEYRLLHGTHNKITTDLRPITIGVRW
jgi:hypothetical protein